MDASLLKGLQWYSTQHPEEDGKTLCPTRDVFQARLDSMYRTWLGARENINEVSLRIAVVGELGNNCFDHNLGKWNDVAGCWLHCVFEKGHHWIVIADRGQGVLASLRHVEPTLASHHTALETAFRKQISGRAPEQRGNGLKFVRSVINGHPRRGLCCLSGDGALSFGGTSPALVHWIASSKISTNGIGTCVVVGWGL